MQRTVETVHERKTTAIVIAGPSIDWRTERVGDVPSFDSVSII